MKSARSRSSQAQGFILASTTGGNDFRSVMRVLVGVGCAACATLLVALLTQGLLNDDSQDLVALLPAVAGAASGALGIFVLAPRLIAQPPSHFLEFRGDSLTIHPAGGGQISFRNASLQVEYDTSSIRPIALTVKGRRFALATCYSKVDRAGFLTHSQSGRGVKFRSPRIELRAHKGFLRAVRIVATGRYTSIEKPFS